MAYEMETTKENLEMIRQGKKTIELRLLYHELRILDVGDYIIFSGLDNKIDKLAVKIKGLLRFSSFRELFEIIPPRDCGMDDVNTVEDAINKIREDYSEELECMLGVLGICITPVELEYVLEEEKRIAKRIAEAEFERFFPDGMK